MFTAHCLLFLPSLLAPLSHNTTVRNTALCQFISYAFCKPKNYRFRTTRQSLLSSRKAIRKFPEPWFNIILLSLKPSKRSITEVLCPVSFHHTAKQNGSTFFHPSFLSFFPPAKEKKKTQTFYFRLRKTRSQWSYEFRYITLLHYLSHI